MGIHHNQQVHRRAVANQRRLAAADNDEEAALESLNARFSPTASYSETMTAFTDTPTDTATLPPVSTSTTPPPPPPTTTTPVAPTTPTSTPPAITDTTVTPAQPSTTVLPPTTTSSTDVITTPLIATTPTAATQQTIIVTSQTSGSVASSAASSTPSSSSSGGTDVGGIIGGIAGGLLGLVVLSFIIRFILNRRNRNKEAGASAFNADTFRRSAVLMNEPPTHDDTVQRGFNPRPPSMIERRLASPAPTFGTQYGEPGPGPYGAPGGYDYGNMDQYGRYQSSGPGQLMNNMSPPVSATSAHPMYTNSAYGQSPFSPIGSPVSARGPSYDGSQAAILTRQSSSATQLSRQPSAGGANGYPQNSVAQYAAYPNQTHSSAQNAYVDLNRSSVTPYQAAQYAEISQRLNTDVPAGLDTPAVNKFVQYGNEGVPPVPGKDTASPFADPVPAALFPGARVAVHDPRHSTDSVSRDLDDFPAPPSPVPTERSRVEANPPMLPEIQVESRVASYDFPISVRGSDLENGITGDVGKEFTKSPLANQFPATPSPLASSFGIATPPAAAASFPAAAPAPAVNAAEKARPVTVYEDEDAYGGI